MGLAIAPLGFYYGFITTALPILLAAQGVPVDRIAYISAVGFSPTFWAFLVCPILDVRFTKRTYGFVLEVLAAICLCATVLLLKHLALMTFFLTLGCTATVMFGNAVMGWLPDIIEDKHYAQVGAWSNVANLGAAGAFGTLAVVLVRTLPIAIAAPILAVVLIVPTALLLFFPAPVPPTRGVAEMFRTLFRDLYRLCRSRRCLLGLMMFLSPASCFALTNLFSGLGKDFHAPERWVTAIGGAGVAVVCSLGCVVAIGLCQRFARSVVYLTTGLCGAVFALGLIWSPHTLAAFAVGVLGYNFCQGMNYTAFTALTFEIVGPANPLAATQMGLLAASANLPISYMTALDGRVYASHGLTGMLLNDGGMSVLAGCVLLVILNRLGRPKALVSVSG
jgi:MFS transporter, PAT family, beta-lactamase induction signal transducer AmpG